MNYNLIKQLNEVIMGKVIILGNFWWCTYWSPKINTNGYRLCQKNNMKTIVYTFNTLPNNKKAYNDSWWKLKKIKSLGVDDIYIDDFYRVKNYSPLEFINEILIGLLGAKSILWL